MFSDSEGVSGNSDRQVRLQKHMPAKEHHRCRQHKKNGKGREKKNLFKFNWWPTGMYPRLWCHRYPPTATPPSKPLQELNQSLRLCFACAGRSYLWEIALLLSRLTLRSDWFSTWCQILYTIISSWERLIGDWFSLSLAMRDKTLFTSLLFSALMAEWTMKSNILSSSRISKRNSCVIWTYILILLSESNDFVICASGSLLRKGRGWRTAGLSWSWDVSSRLRESWTATGPGSTEQVGSVFGSQNRTVGSQKYDNGVPRFIYFQRKWCSLRRIRMQDLLPLMVSQHRSSFLKVSSFISVLLSRCFSNYSKLEQLDI